MEYKDYVTSIKYCKRVYYDPFSIKELYDIWACPGYDVYGNEYRIIWDVKSIGDNVDKYVLKEIWRYNKLCGTWCRW